MNVFFHELRMRLKGQLGWVFAMVVFMVLSVAKFSTLSSDAGASQALLKQFPATVQAIFGMTGLDLTTLSGYFGILFIYILVILSIHAGMLGSGVLADEERDKTTEFLFVKPRDRARIVTAKWLAGLVYVALQWAVVVASTFVAIQQVAHPGNFASDFWWFMLALAIVQVTMYALGSLAASWTSNVHVPNRLVAIFVFVSYLCFALVKLSPSVDFLKYISVFCYFDAGEIIRTGTLHFAYVVVCAVATIAAIVGTYVFYRRRDLNV